MGMYSPTDPYKTQEQKDAWLTGEKSRLKGAWEPRFGAETTKRTAWNQGIGNIWDQASGAKTALAGLDYTQGQQDLKNRIASSQSRQSTLSGFSSPDASFQTRWGGTTPWNTNYDWSASDIGLTGTMPGITGKTRQAVSGLVGQNLAGAQNLLSTGRTKRSEWDTYASGQKRDLGALESSLAGYGGGITRSALPGGRVYTDQATLARERGETTAGLSDNLFAGDLGYGTRYGAVETGLQGLIDKRKAEEKRISDYGTGLRTDISAQETALGGYDITNKTELDKMLQDLLTQTQGARGFSSKLDYDFGDELSRIGTVASGGQSLLSDRKAEERRIEQAVRDYGSTAGSLKGRAGRLGTRNLSDIEDIGIEAAAERAGMGRFSSLLPTDFSGIETTLGEAETSAGAAKTKRFSELDALKGLASPYATTLASTPLYDENAMRRLLDKIGGGASDVSAYGPGAKAEEAMKAYKTQAGGVEGKLEQLAQKRTGLEQQAQQFLTGSRLGYTGVGQVGAAEGSLEALRAEIEKYGATQGEDELQRIMAQLQSERGRLVDAQRTAAARPQGSPAAAGQYNFGLPGRMSPEEYLALVSRRRSRDEELYPGAFGSLV